MVQAGDQNALFELTTASLLHSCRSLMAARGGLSPLVLRMATGRKTRCCEKRSTMCTGSVVRM